MKTETVDLTPQPMIYVTRRTQMAPGAIQKAMGEAFQALGAFIGAKQVPVVGPPLALYRDYEPDGSFHCDVGFPVAEAGLALAEGEVKAGRTPAGRAIKAIHQGPYDTLRDSWTELEAELKKAGTPMPPIAWEVYISDPDKTPPADLKTELYLPVS